MFKKELIQYCDDVLSEKIFSCKKHKWACMRFLDDLQKENTENFPYIFDEAAGLSIINWIEMFKHTKGVLAGKPIVLDKIQKFVLGNVYGWLHTKTRLRRFKKMYWQVARKNAKSQTMSGIVSYEAFVLGGSNEKKEVYCTATKTEQAKIVFTDCLDMLNKQPALKNKFKLAYNTITHLKSGSTIKALSKEDTKTGDGLNPQCASIDEYHAHPDSKMYDIMVSGMMARAQPLLAIITTAGFELENPCYRVEYNLVSKILDPDNDIKLESYFAMVNELDEGDDLEDRNNWKKANPIVMSYSEGLDNLEAEYAMAKIEPEKMRGFLTKNLNIWINESEASYMPMDKWNACKGDLGDLSGSVVYIGVDLSKRFDLTSVAFIFPTGSGWKVFTHSFIPTAQLLAKETKDRVPYGLWIQQGYLSKTTGEIVDYYHVVNWIEKKVDELNLTVKMIAIDPYCAGAVNHIFLEKGYEVVEISQIPKNLSMPTKDFKAAVLEGKVIHDGSPLTSWAMSNAIVIEDSNENIKLDKSAGRHRIDPVSAIMNAFVHASLDTYTKQNMGIYIF